VVFYVLGAAVAAWGFEVLRRTSEQRDAAEAALGAERAERVVAEERAATAAHLHDSVLQTLALIQRRSDDPGEVVGLARSQERGLRDWLAQRDQPLASQESFGAALDTVAAEVERLHRVRVEIVHVGDRDLDVGLSAVVGAVREALVNAAKHAGVAEIRVYAEAGPRGASVFVRDRGSGFDPTGVAPDRRGIAGSVIGRVRSAGGRALVRSSPGGGTEVEITMPCHGDTDMG
jgi:signal transduction histidine kinase